MILPKISRKTSILNDFQVFSLNKNPWSNTSKCPVFMGHPWWMGFTQLLPKLWGQESRPNLPQKIHEKIQYILIMSSEITKDVYITSIIQKLKEIKNKMSSCSTSSFWKLVWMPCSTWQFHKYLGVLHHKVGSCWTPPIPTTFYSSLQRWNGDYLTSRVTRQVRHDKNTLQLQGVGTVDGLDILRSPPGMVVRPCK